MKQVFFQDHHMQVDGMAASRSVVAASVGGIPEVVAE